MLLDLGLALGKAKQILTKMLTFNGTNAYGELPEPVTFSGDFEIEIEFATTSTSNQILIGDDYLNTYYFNLSPGTGTISAWIAGTESDWTGVSAGLADGVLHTIKFVLAGTSMELFVDNTSQGTKTVAPYTGVNKFIIGNSNTVNSYFNGIIKSVKLTDLTTPANSREYRLNSGNTLYELPQGESLGSELVTNGDFSDTASIDTTIAPLAGWTNTGTHNALNKCTIENGAMRLISDGTSIGVIQDIVEVGKTYLVTFDLLQNDGAGVKITQYVNNVNYGGTGTGSKSWVFTASGLDTNVYIQRQSGACDAIIDNFSVKEIPKALLYNNVVAGDWGDYYFDASLGTNGGWVSKTDASQVLLA